MTLKQSRVRREERGIWRIYRPIIQVQKRLQQATGLDQPKIHPDIQKYILSKDQVPTVTSGSAKPRPPSLPLRGEGKAVRLSELKSEPDTPIEVAATSPKAFIEVRLSIFLSL